MPKFTESKTDRAYESFMQQIPGFQRDPPEADIISVTNDNGEEILFELLERYETEETTERGREK